ncbi:putative periplasmic lipoprotein [Cytobacillus dafuensis]|uniref:DUF4352 domain-containing protein n=1 Tax=Cytobacillus dafuensis TaxID=1742359 RepID=A0A5B8Z5E4_CYTDA|nr:hypothetical protein [Cytobacillus dafuensis]QED48171.1 hypothetical protein FSZ17_13515 [Cytobacillus dafuensis]
MKKLLLIFAIAALLTACTHYSGGEPVDQQKEEVNEDEKGKSEEVAEAKIKSLEEEDKILAEQEEQINTLMKVRNIITNNLGARTNIKKDRIVEVEVNDHAGTEAEGDKIILITLNGDENLTSEMTVKGLLMNSGVVFQKVFKNEEVEEVALFWQLPLVNSYANTTDENVIKITLTKDTFNKIEWKNFDYNNFKEVADQFWMHDALKE